MDKLSNLRSYSIILLSAGAGKRMGKLGKNFPKSLLKLNGSTALDKIINQLQIRKAKNISIIVGYQSKKIINHLKKRKGINFKFIKIKNFQKNGHSYSWYSFRKLWNKNKKPILMLHTDIIFDQRFLDNIINSKRKNIIGIKSKKNHKFKRKSFTVKVDKNNMIKAIDYNFKNNNTVGEILCINKFSTKMMKKIFRFMKSYFKNYGKDKNWEIVINQFIKDKKPDLFVIKNQCYDWINLNTPKDYFYAVKLAKSGAL